LHLRFRQKAAAKTTQVKENEGLCESMPLPGMPPLIVVGRVTHITPENCPLKFNDRVLGLLPDEMYYSQTYAKLPFDSLMKIKNNLDPWQQVSIALSYLPALQALQSAPFTVGKNKVLLNGGLGPVNQALIRLCQLHNAKKIYVPCEPQYASLVRELGAKPLGPNHSDWGALFYESIDIVIDSIGQNGFITSKVVLVETGHLVVLGSKDMDSKKGELSYPMNKAFVDWRLKTSLRTSIFDYMRVFKTDRESFKVRKCKCVCLRFKYMYYSFRLSNDCKILAERFQLFRQDGMEGRTSRY
jgi:NADPH:quinone reductase-like Zn-dependent oxidoreductase